MLPARRFGASCRRGLRVPARLDVESGKSQTDTELAGFAGGRRLRGLGVDSLLCHLHRHSRAPRIPKGVIWA
eukprot:334160-Pyramimonas_sp.AAC.1